MKNKAAQELGKLGGKAKTDAKAKAARENGKRGGRPKKSQLCSNCYRSPFDCQCPRPVIVSEDEAAK